MQDLAVRLDLFLRGGAVTSLAICALLFLANRTAWPRGLSVPALCVGMSAYLLVSSPNLGLTGGWARHVLIMLAGVVPVLTVWAGAEIFLDRPEFRPWQGAVAILIAGAAWLAPVVPELSVLRGILVVVLYGGLLYIALSTATGDLVETRRRFRRWFVAVMALAGLGISVVEVLQLDADLPPVMYPLHASGFLVMTVLFMGWATRIAPDLWPARQIPKPSAAAPLSGAERAVLQRVHATMAQGIWRQEGLTVAALAAAVNAPEHRVRRAINKGLGYRNFAQFVNAHRIEAACAILADPAQADASVLSIAYDVGFASVGPFNRAFREKHQQSPTEYRNRHGASNG